MIETENSDPMRAAWTDYRQTLTSYVLEGIESYYRRAHLARQGKLRDQAFTLEADVPLEAKPVVAIWGAGRCNDLDLEMLAPYVRFVLIDRTMEDIQAARARYGLSEAQCVCVDLGFWEIYEEEERFLRHCLRMGTICICQNICVRSWSQWRSNSQHLRDMKRHLISVSCVDLPVS